MMGCKTRTSWVIWVFLIVLLSLLVCVSTDNGIPEEHSPKFRHPKDFTIKLTTPSPIPTTRPHCWEPEQCCVYPFDSEEFQQCCDQHGCCPLTCPLTLPGGDIAPSKECSAWQCCVYREGSPEYRECCNHHRCCPPCNRVSSGCCYNGIRYNFRTVIQEFSEVCLQLVCSAKLMPDYPYFAARIAAVKTCSFDDGSTRCVDCPVHQCVDEFGIMHMEGEVWYPNSCVKCECRHGYILCQGVKVTCPPPPHPKCVPLPGPCCPTYHCEDGCVDDAGVFRPVGSHWPSTDPCKILKCEEGGVETEETLCHTPPPPHEGCHLMTVPGECCPQWNCSHCVDNDGTVHHLYEQWQTDSCTLKMCTPNGIVVNHVDCPALGPAPHETCVPQVPKGGCCEEWKCDGCWEDGVLHPVGSHWPSDDPCIHKWCKVDGIKLRQIPCPDYPRPHESCFLYMQDNTCCPIWNCSGCLDEDGAYYPLYHEWQTDPCTTNVCHLNGITSKPVLCPELGPAPHYTCYQASVTGSCCKEWKCDGCVDENGQFRPVGSEWSTSDPCQKRKCISSGGIQNITTTCKPRPHDGCLLKDIEGQCCGEWICSGCLDDEGNVRDLYETWNSDLCTSHVCAPTGIETREVACRPLPKPHYSCSLVQLPGDCCPTWDCLENSSKCYDYEGNVYESGEEWPTGEPCKIYRCESGTIITVPTECQTIPPTPNCFKKPVVEGQCCPTWNCSGCLDEEGVFHSLGEVWVSDTCIAHNCTSLGITKNVVACPPPPRPGCVPGSRTDDGCCYTWNCPPTNCSTVRCQGPPWNADCTAYMPLGQCCPVYVCGPPHNAYHKPNCAAVLCKGPPLREECVVYATEVCCPKFECRADLFTYNPNPPTCDGVMCKAPRMERNCTVLTPPTMCCPEYHCN